MKENIQTTDCHVQMHKYHVIQSFCHFIKSSNNRTWIQNDAINIYIRKSTRFIEGDEREFIDIANIYVSEAYQDKGFFQSVLKEMIEFTDLNFYAENVCSDRSHHIFEKFGFKNINLDHLQSAPLVKICDLYFLNDKKENKK